PRRGDVVGVARGAADELEALRVRDRRAPEPGTLERAREADCVGRRGAGVAVAEAREVAVDGRNRWTRRPAGRAKAGAAGAVVPPVERHGPLDLAQGPRGHVELVVAIA